VGWLIATLFFLSGATALIGEVVWMRMLGLVLGNTVWAASTVVAVWMAGMAAGSVVGARLAPRIRRHLRLYGIAEAGVAVFYAVSPWLHQLLLRVGRLVGADLGAHPGLGITQRFVLSALALAVPTVLMGLTLPLLVERLRGARLTARVGLLYGVNTLGAATGVLLTGYLLLPLLGERGTLAAAATVSAVVAATAVLSERLVPPATAVEEQPSARVAAPMFLVLVAAMGFAALAAELVWVRILVLHLGSRVYAFALLLGVYLAGLAIGSLVARAVLPRLGMPGRSLGLVQATLACTLVVQLMALGWTGELMAWLAAVLRPPATFGGLQLVMVLAVVALFLPVTVLFGASFPLAVAADPARRSAGAHTGVVGAANTAGAIAGAVAAPFLLVPHLGSQRTLLLLAAVHAAVAILLSPRRGVIAATAAAVVGVAVCAVALPGDWVLRQADVVEATTSELLELDEAVGATVVVKRYIGPQGSWRSLELNGMNVAGTDPALLAVQQLQGNLPLLQVANPERVLHIGFGSGGTCWAVSRYPVDRIDVVEISPQVLAASDTWFADVNHGVLADPRVHVILNDGRNYLLATDTRYDAILSDSIHPLYAGNSTLYTKEYFELCRAHLKPGGVASMWLPLYSLDPGSYLRILRAFHEVFPRTAVWYDITTVNENTVVTGMVEPGPLDLEWSRLADPGPQESLESAGIRTRDDLVCRLLLGPDQVEPLTMRVPPLQDDLPYVEYTAGRLMRRNASWLANLEILYQARARSDPFADVDGFWKEAVRRRDGRMEAILAALRGR
jgi:spermidine synthase